MHCIKTKWLFIVSACLLSFSEKRHIPTSMKPNITSLVCIIVLLKQPESRETNMECRICDRDLKGYLIYLVPFLDFELMCLVIKLCCWYQLFITKKWF